jgi:cytochrome c5
VIKHLDVFGSKWFYVKCQWCYAEINNLVPSEEEAIEAWNRRADDGKENEKVWHLQALYRRRRLELML